VQDDTSRPVRNLEYYGYSDWLLIEFYITDGRAATHQLVIKNLSPKHRVSAEPGAPPNGGPAEPLGNSSVGSGPPSMNWALGIMNNPARFRRPRSWVTILIVGLSVAVLFVLGVPNFVGHGPGKINAILNNLRQIDGASQQWATSRGQTGAVTATWADIAPYLPPASGPQGSVRQVAGERYVLKPLTQPPEAVLTREVEGHPKGTVVRFSTNGEVEVIQPNKDAR
jgi:hypothetical protein